MRGRNVPCREMSAACLSYIPLNAGEQTVVLLPRSPSPSKRYFPIPLDSLEEEYRMRSADDGKLFREEFNVSGGCGAQASASRAPNTHRGSAIKCYVCMSQRCGFFLISRGLSPFFTVAAVLLPPRVLRGGEQRAQQREKQIPQHFTM